jgi:arylsulfatase A-like enzyme
VLSLYWALLLGGLIGALRAIHDVWFVNQYVQKGLRVFVLEIAARHLLTPVVAVFVTLALVGPCIGLAGRIAGVARPTLLRIALLLSGVACLAAGYRLNKSSWFPSFWSAPGVAANLLVGLLFLGLALALYRLGRRRWEGTRRLPFGAFAARFYSGRLLALLACGLAAFVGFAAWRVSAQRPPGPNLLLLSIDTLRADHLGCYGYPHPTSPTIDQLAAEGVRFEHAYAPRGMTWPSLTTMMTSLYPKTHRERENQVPLEAQYVTLTEVLKNAGYRTAAFLANFYYSPNRGFDVKKGDEVGDLDTSMTRQAVEWLDRLDPKRDRFFLWLHQKNPHIPYNPPKRDLAHLMALYDAEVRSSDANLQHVLAKLKEKGLEQNTLVVFIADHGEELYSHQNYFYHQCSIYDSVLRIPLVLKLPGVLDAGKVIEHQVQNLDLTPTLLQLLKLPIPEAFEGRTFLPLLFGESEHEPRPAFAERTDSIYSIRTPDWKYIYNPSNLTPECLQRRSSKTTPYVILSEELYRVREDPGETRNVVAEHPEAARQLRAQLVEWVETNKRFHKKHELSKEAEERLRALGYVN